MDVFTRQDLIALVERRPEVCVSLFMPTHRSGPEIQEDRIRLKVLLAQAQQGLLEQGMRTPEAKDLLAPGRSLVEDGLFWQQQADGLALFMDRQGSRSYRVPMPLKELLVVSDRYDVKPLIPLLHKARHFHILALSLKKARLFRATPFAIDEIRVPGMPEGISETLRYDDLQKDQVQFHTESATPKPGGKRPPVFHGTGEADRKEEARRYLRDVQRAVEERLKADDAPLVLAGVDFLTTLYREVSKRPALVADNLPGNADETSAKDLLEPAAKLVEPHLAREEAEALARFGDMSALGKTTTGVEEAVNAAFQARVDTLFVPCDVERWGTFDPSTGETDEHGGGEPAPGEIDLLSVAATYTLAHGGNVFCVQEDRMPLKATAATILRF